MKANERMFIDTWNSITRFSSRAFTLTRAVALNETSQTKKIPFVLWKFDASYQLLANISENFQILHTKFFLSSYKNNKMGRDHTSKQHARSGHRQAPKSDNVYLKLLVKLYSFLARM